MSLETATSMPRLALRWNTRLRLLEPLTSADSPDGRTDNGRRSSSPDSRNDCCNTAATPLNLPAAASPHIDNWGVRILFLP